MLNALFTFTGVRQHFLSDRYYNICLFEDSIKMTEANPKVQTPKYILPLTLKTVIEIKGQVAKGKKNLSGFIFKYQNRSKLMVADSNDLISLIELVGNKITFLEITLFYQAVEIIGRGSSSSVSVLFDKFTEKKYAVKSIDKLYLKSNDKEMILFENEVLILQKLAQFNSEKYFIHLYQVFESQTSYYLVLDLMKGKSLTDYVQKYKKKTAEKILPRDQVRTILNRLLSGVALLHQNRIIHRDLKPDNLLLGEPFVLESLAIGDYGLATFQDVNNFPYPICGTQGYMAPEVQFLTNKRATYNEKSDIYSCGVIFFWLLTGEIKINLDHFMLKFYDQTTKDLLYSMLEQQPKNRISAINALLHPYFLVEEDTKKTQQSSKTTKIGNENIDYSLIKENHSFNVYITPRMKQPNQQEEVIYHSYSPFSLQK